jgi:hypothetical protein
MSVTYEAQIVLPSSFVTNVAICRTDRPEELRRLVSSLAIADGVLLLDFGALA